MTTNTRQKSIRQNKRERLSEETKLLILSKYESGISAKDIAYELGLNDTTIPKIVKKLKGVKSLIPYQGNTDYFDKIDSHQKAYYLGFIAADGCIVDNKNTSRVDTLSINIHEKDRFVLEKFSEDLQREAKLYLVPSKSQVSIRFQNQHICDALKSYGLGYRKSLTLPNIVQNIPKEYRCSFILGYFDGDGWASIYITKYKDKSYSCLNIGFCGTENFLKGIAEEIGLKTYSIRHSPGTTKNSTNGIYNLTFASKLEVNKVYRYMYTGRTIYFKRKHDKFIQFIIPDEDYQKLLNQDQTIS